MAVKEDATVLNNTDFDADGEEKEDPNWVPGAPGLSALLASFSGIGLRKLDLSSDSRSAALKASSGSGTVMKPDVSLNVDSSSYYTELYRRL